MPNVSLNLTVKLKQLNLSVGLELSVKLDLSVKQLSVKLLLSVYQIVSIHQKNNVHNLICHSVEVVQNLSLVHRANFK